MAPTSPLPDTDDHELSSYAPSHPLLSNDTPAPPARRKRQTRSTRWWKPIAVISVPIVLILIYAVVHPHVPGLPALPRVVIQGSEPARVPYYSEDSECTCGHTREGERLCEVYHREALRSTRLVQGTGARIRRILLAAREGKALKIGILGGSGE